MPITGYADTFSAAAGQDIAFKVHCDRPGTYRATIHRIRSADVVGVGFKTSEVAAASNGEYPARRQKIELGSYVAVAPTNAFDLTSFALVAHIWPTTPTKGRQAVLGTWDEATSTSRASSRQSIQPRCSCTSTPNMAARSTTGTDGSGVCYSSRLRPVLNMRPKERLWQLPADTHNHRLARRKRGSRKSTS